MIKSVTIEKISAALLEAQKNMGNASKDAKNPFFKSKFADLNAVREAVTGPLHDAGISILQPTVYIDGKSFVETTLLHTSGEYIQSHLEIVCAKQNDPQAFGSALSYARRYSLSSMLSVGAEDTDAEDAMDRAHSQPKHAIASTVSAQDSITKFNNANTVKPVIVSESAPVLTPKPAFGGGARSPFRKA